MYHLNSTTTLATARGVVLEHHPGNTFLIFELFKEFYTYTFYH